ncbi:trace amine-associated receptor 4-like [Lethenteron reissneri]|uniref:trace amine-associated receptor 4-like n=1 Tax=Lethenteron reissneri TaxID=7753 RepID=UPI002AB70725|nr:trace amine-associated receptor 4-like [Lethenteron reissneri]
MGKYASPALALNSSVQNGTFQSHCVLTQFNLVCRQPTVPPEYAEVILIAMIISIILNMFGNTLIIAAILYFKQLQVLPNAFTFSLSVADILVGVVVMPFYMNQCVYNCWFYGHAFCKVHHFLHAFLPTASTMHLCCIGYDRYLAICDPFHYQERFTRRTAAIALAATWLGSLLYVVPIMLDWIVIGIEEMVAERTCPDNCIFFMNKVFSSCGAFFSFMLPMGIMTVTYAKIYRIARKQARSIGAQQHGMLGQTALGFNKQQWAAMKREHNATKTVSIILGIFMICWAPFFSTIVIDPYLNYTTKPVVWEMLNWIGHVNSAINPFLYGGFNRTFRNAIRIIFSRRLLQPGIRSAEL